MPDLHDLLEGAVDAPAPLDLDQLGRRVATRRRRRLAGFAVTVVVLAGSGAAAVLLTDPDGRSADSAVDVATASTDPPAAPASVPGGPGGAPPCAAPGAGEEGASVEHPERAPLQAEVTFGGGVRWAVCGADPAFSGALLNLRSDDGGETWSVTDTGLSMAPFHAGDRVDVALTTETVGQIHLVSEVGERSDRYATSDGGLVWSPA